MGASRLLSFAKPAAVWTLEDIEDDTVELMDDSELLNEEDLVKPDPASLHVCGTTLRIKLFQSLRCVVSCVDHNACVCGKCRALNIPHSPISRHDTEEEFRAKARTQGEKCLAAKDTNRQQEGSASRGILEINIASHLT